MHPDLQAPHNAVKALLKANQAVKKAARAYDREALPPQHDMSFYLRDSVTFSASPKEEALYRATQRQDKAAGRVEHLWDMLRLDHDTPQFPKPTHLPNGKLTEHSRRPAG